MKIEREKLSQTLYNYYKKGVLVPFTGAGMSMNACNDWAGLVKKLEDLTGVIEKQSTDFTQRSFHIMEHLRKSEPTEIANTIRAALYTSNSDHPTNSNAALARLYWPLVITTNYDDNYLVAKSSHFAKVKKKRHGSRIGGTDLRLYGRSRLSCSALRDQLLFPDSESLWAIQGFLRPRTNLRSFINTQGYKKTHELEDEIVLGHSEYRQAANNSEHFRRTFSNVFLNNSLLFLGSSLSEPYFMTLFDEVIEGYGWPKYPHFALIKKGKIDAEFLHAQYNIIAYEYKEHNEVVEVLDRLFSLQEKKSYRALKTEFSVTHRTAVQGRPNLNQVPASGSFSICTRGLPTFESLGSEKEVIAISAGLKAADTADHRGRALFNRDLQRKFSFRGDQTNWVNGWTCSIGKSNQLFGICARENHNGDELRTPKVIADAFFGALQHFETIGVKKLHVQLLAAGEKRSFPPWISLLKMARGYGDYARKSQNTPVTVNVYVVDPGVISLLDRGHLDISSELERADFTIEIVRKTKSGEKRSSVLANQSTQLGKLFSQRERNLNPSIRVSPTVNDTSERTLNRDWHTDIEGLGAVAGSRIEILFDPRS